MQRILSFFRSILILFYLSGFSTVIYANMTLIDISGKKIPFSSLQGKWVMINYWASWCQPCLDEISELNAFYYRHHDQVAVFAVNFDGVSLQQQQQLIKTYQITYPSLRDDPAEDLALGELVGVPATFVFNPQGQLVNTLYGGQTIDSLEAAIHDK